MNYLAHLYLSFDDEQIAIGNFIADFVKGKKMYDFDEQITNGIIIHREIDSFTDSHPLVIQAKRRLSKYRHYAGVIVDMYYDHFLSKNWNKYSDESLKEFTSRHYELVSNFDQLPEKSEYLLHHMSQTDWLYNYQFLEGLETALTGMSRRTPYVSKMDEAVVDLRDNYEAFENEFHLFFVEVIDHIRNFASRTKNK